MNIQAMMAQARKLQKNLEKTTNEIDNTVFKYENENILLECTGDNEVKKVEIKNEDILADKEMVEDIVLVAINDVLGQIKKEMYNFFVICLCEDEMLLGVVDFSFSPLMCFICFHLRVRARMYVRTKNGLNLLEIYLSLFNF